MVYNQKISKTKITIKSFLLNINKRSFIDYTLDSVIQKIESLYKNKLFGVIIYIVNNHYHSYCKRVGYCSYSTTRTSKSSD